MVGRIDSKFHNVQIVRIDADALYLQVDGGHFRILWEACSASLAEASAVEREVIEIAPSGYGLHWPLLDEDLAIEPLLTLAQEMETVDVSAGG